MQLGSQEEARLAALDRYDILDTPREESFDRIARVARSALQVPIATVSVIDAHRQWHKASEGLPGRETPRRDTFCTHTIKHQAPLIVPDATQHPDFAQNPSVVGEPHVRFYAGIPLTTKDGHNIGTLCVVDTKPRQLASDQLDLLLDLAKMAMEEIELRQLATTDSLTGALSRRAFREQGNRAVALALRHHQDLSCLAFDLDHFKLVNDTYGHSAGDTVLVQVADVATKLLRQSDLMGRLGGEEFALLLPQAGPKGATEIAQRLRTTIEGLRFDFGSAVTASFGLASLDPATRDLDSLLQNADKALYEAKAAGRNRVIQWAGAEAVEGQPRRRVLKGGQILFNGRRSAIDCTVRSLSDDGAGVDVSSTVGVPKQFELIIAADGLDRTCRIRSRTDRHMDLEFVA